MKIPTPKTGSFTGLGFLLCFLISCAPSFRMSEKKVDQYFKNLNINGSQHSYNVGFREIHYVKAGDETKPLVLFVHGSPGSLSSFIHFLGDTILSKHALLVSTDRPGFGNSNFGNAEPSLEQQAAILKPIIERYKNNQSVVLVGHSLGGPLVVRMAMDYPELIDALVIVAGAIDPELEPNESWFRAPLASPFLSWILPGSFRASNEEIYKLKPELEKMLPLWKKVTCPVIVIQGKKDSLVPAGNADFAKKMLVNARVNLYTVEDMDHFVPWSNPELIHDAVLNFLLPQQQIVDVYK